MIMTRNGVIIRLPIKGVSLQGRNTQGVRLINVEPGDEVIDVARVANEDEENGARERAAGVLPPPPVGAPAGDADLEDEIDIDEEEGADDEVLDEVDEGDEGDEADEDGGEDEE
jgi:DNA gyrase subunit A